jgi:hypothetical protein
MIHLHWYRTVELSRLDRYSQCRCGKRKWEPLAVGGYWPVDHAWLRGEGVKPWDRPMKPPPPTPSGSPPARQTERPS